MSNSIKNSVKNRKWSVQGVLTVLAAFLLGILICWMSALHRYELFFDFIPVLEGFQASLVLDLTSLLFPVLVCLPGVMRMYEERSGGYEIYHVLRIGRNKYAIYKLLESMINGAMVVFGAVTIYFIYAVFRAIHWHRPLNFTTDLIGDEYESNIYYIWMKEGYGECVFLVNILFLIALAMFWNIVGTVVSVFIVNCRVAIVAPFLFKRFLDWLIPDWLYFLNPSNLCMSAWVTNLPCGGLWYGVLYLLFTFLLGWGIIFVKLSVEVAK